MLKPKRILVIDPDEQTRSLMASILQPSGYQVVAIAKALEADDIFSRTAPAGPPSLLGIEANSWWGRVYGHYIQGEAHIRSLMLMSDPQFKADLRQLKLSCGPILKGGYMGAYYPFALILDQLERGLVEGIADFIATRVAPWEETKEFMRGVEEDIQARLRTGVVMEDIRAVSKEIIEHQIDEAVNRHPSVFRKGRKFPGEAPSRDVLKNEIETWVGDQVGLHLHSYIAGRLLSKIAENSGTYLGASLGIYERHSQSNAMANPGEPLFVERPPASPPTGHPAGADVTYRARNPFMGLFPSTKHQQNNSFRIRIPRISGQAWKELRESG